MAFKLGSESREYNESSKNRFNKDDASVPGVPVIRKDLAKGIKAEANIDGSIFLSDKLDPNSEKAQQVVMHEMIHVTDMKVGKLAYTDDDITWMGESYDRKKGKINYNGEWLPEGDTTFPWEQH